MANKTNTAQHTKRNRRRKNKGKKEGNTDSENRKLNTLVLVAQICAKISEHIKFPSDEEYTC